MNDEQETVEVDVSARLITDPQYAEEMMSVVIAASLALWANKTDKMDEFAAWMRERKEMITFDCGNPAHTEPHSPFAREFDADMADQFLHYFVKYAMPMIRFGDSDEPVTSGPSPYL